MQLLHIEGSPRGARSYSSRAAEALVAGFLQAKPGATARTIEVAETALPAFDGAALDAKYAIMGGREHTSEQAAAWRAIEGVIADFTSADAYVFSAPMWNFGLPYALKHYFDVLIQPGYTFRWTAEKGYEGLVLGKPAAIVVARGGEYPEGAAVDHQKPHLELLLGFIGITDVATITVEPTLAMGPEEAEARLERALVRAREAGVALAAKLGDV